MEIGADSVAVDIKRVASLVQYNEWFNGEHFVIPVIVLAILATLVFSIFKLGARKVSFSDFVSRNLIGIAIFVCIFGTVIYFVGYSHQGTGRNLITLLIRSVLSSFEMFLSKSNLIGISQECKDSPLYMFCFAIVHAVALAITMIFVISCFGKRVRDWFKLVWWKVKCRLLKSHREIPLYVFWGINEKNILLANDVQKSENKNIRMVFVDFPVENQENKSGQSFSGILGLLSYKVSVVKQLYGINYVMMKTDMSLSEQEIALSAKSSSNDVYGFLESMHLYKLSKLLKLHTNVTFFVLSDDLNANLRSTLRLLDRDKDGHISKIYCCTRRKRTALIHEEVDSRLRIVDDSHESVIELALNHKELSQPINYVDVDTNQSVVSSTFTSMIVGFGYTGQDALKFLYEFSAFPDKDGNKSQVKHYVFDRKINEVKGEIYQEIPAMAQIEESGEIEFCPYNYGSVDFIKKLNQIITELNYVVIATGDDALNMQIATQLFEFAMQYRTSDSKFERFKIFVRIYDSSSKFLMEQTIKRYDKNYAEAFVLFGDPKDIYKKQWLIDDLEVHSAAQFCEAYNEASNVYVTDESGVVSSKKRIRDNYKDVKLLCNRNSLRTYSQNRANVRHCYTKSVLLGLDKMVGMPEIPKWDSLDVKSLWHKKLLNVSICEHLRWNASHQMLGYTTWPQEEANEYSDSCDWLTKRHKYLVPWGELSHDVQKYDYVVVAATINMNNNNKSNN